MPSKSSQERPDLGKGLELRSGFLTNPNQQVWPIDKYLSFQLVPGFFTEVIALPAVQRLKRISQLQRLTTMQLTGEVRHIEGNRPHVFSHNRFDHSLLASALLRVMMGAEYYDEEFIVALVAELVHDINTVPGGDSWKSVRQQQRSVGQINLFEEDDGFVAKFEKHSGRKWQKSCRKNGLNPDVALGQIEQIVSGNGLYGQLHEIADTGSYMLKDIAALREMTTDFADIIAFADSHPWDVWHNTRVIGGKAVILKPDVLCNFLHLRAMLWALVYNAPATKFLEILLRMIVYPSLVEKGSIDVSELLMQDDAWLWQVVEDGMGWGKGACERLDLLGAWPQWDDAFSWEEVVSQENKLHQQGHFALAVKPDQFQRAKSKTGSYYVLDGNGYPARFSDAFPNQAADIERFVQKEVLVYRPQLYWVKNPNLSPRFEEAWARARALEK